MSRPVVAVDLGDSTVATVVDVAPAGPGPEPVDLETDLAAVFAPGDGDALVSGEEARRRGAADPSRYEPTPRRRADDGELLLGTRTVGVAEAWGAVVSDAVARAGPLLRGGRPRGLVLTHPFGWDSGRVELLRRAGQGLADELLLVTEPVAAATYAGWMRPRRAGAPSPVAVLDVGAVTAAASVVAHDGEVLAHRRDDRFGGADADEMLLAHLLADPASGGRAADRFREVAAGATLGDRRHRQVLLDDVRAGKERLSVGEQAEIPLPGGGTAAWLARSEAEEVLRRAWLGVVALLAEVVATAGTTPEQLDAVWLTGGAARTPQLGALVHRELGVPATVAPDPGAVVARGALVVARRARGSGGRAPTPPAADPLAGRSPGTSSPRPPAGPPPSGPAGPPPGGAAPGPASYDPAAPFGPDDPLGWDTGWDVDTDVDLGAVTAARRPTGADGPEPDPDHDTMPIARGGSPGEVYPDEPDPFWLPPDPRATGRRRRRLAAGAVAVALAVLGAGVIAATSRDEPSRGTPIDAYAHRFVVPDGWVRAGGDDAARRTVLRPSDAPHGTALIAVQDDAVDGTDPGVLREQMRSRFDSARAEGSAVGDFQPDARVGERDVVRYRQDVSAGVRVDWVVVLAPGSQVSVGCRYDTADAPGAGPDADRVRAACDEVVSSVVPPVS